MCEHCNSVLDVLRGHGVSIEPINAHGRELDSLQWKPSATPAIKIRFHHPDPAFAAAYARTLLREGRAMQRHRIKPWTGRPPGGTPR